MKIEIGVFCVFANMYEKYENKRNRSVLYIYNTILALEEFWRNYVLT